MIDSAKEMPATKIISQDEYLTYLKGIAVKIDASGISERYRPVALQLMATPFYYAKSEGVEHSKDEEKIVPLTEIAKLYNLQIRGEDLLFPKGGIGDGYRECLELVKKHGYRYGGKGSYKFVRDPQ